MLVLSRNLNQAIVFGEKIKATVVLIDGDTVRLAFDAPAGTTIQHRVKNALIAVRSEAGRAYAVVDLQRHQAVEIGVGIVVSIVRILGDRTQVGIEAPRHVSVCRAEYFFHLK